jgi:chorismate dehydratase
MQQVRLGVVSFLNTVPLIDGLELVDGISLVPNVPSSLIGCLEAGEVDLALASSIDYQKSKESLRILKVGLLSSDGPTLTVRLCSRVPIEEVQEVHCDVDSHTSVVLLQIVLKDMYGKDITIIPTEIRELSKNTNDWPESILMIGDKVISSIGDSQYAHELDLGEAWKDQTGLPFVFAIWMGKPDLEQEVVQFASMSLERQLKRNLQRLEQIVSSSASTRGWNTVEALRYVGGTMQYNWSDRHASSLALFFHRANEIGIISKARKIQYFDCNA